MNGWIITLIVSWIIKLTFICAKHGERKPDLLRKYDFTVAALQVCFQVIILWKAGLFNLL